MIDTSKLEVYNVLKNEKGALRITFRIKDKTYGIIKFFDEEDDDDTLWTLKLWSGANIKKVQSYWSTQTPVLGPERKEWVYKARIKFSDGLKTLQIN